MESPFSGHFNTNYIPSSEEIQCIQNDLVSRAQELAQIDARICELSAQRDRIQAYIDSHKALISHPRRLPPDIVREIFVACLPTDRNAVMSPREAPLLLCRTCSDWRAIALSTPWLWASLNVAFDWVLCNELRKPAIVQWLQRSGACPISLSVTFDYVWHWPNPSISASALLRSLVDFSARWHDVEFMDLTARTLELAGIRPPVLESLKFTGEFSLFAGLDIFTAPTLRAVALHSNHDEHLDDIVLPMPLVWDQLTHLSFQSGWRGFSFQNVLVVLERCKRLVSFRVNLSDSVWFSSGFMLLPFLEILSMKGSVQAQSLSHFIEHVSIPRLREFGVPSLEGHGSFSLVDLGTKSPLIECLDSTIDLAYFIDSDQSLSESLRSFPSLHKLVVSEGVVASPMFDDDQLDSESRTTELLELLTPGRISRHPFARYYRSW